MGKTAKIILSVIGVFVLACLIGSALFVRFAKHKYTEFVQVSQRQQAEARSWAGTHAQGDCVNEGMARVQRCTTFSCQREAQVFTGVCLAAAAPMPGLCAGVPSPVDYTLSAQWIDSRCVAFPSLQSAPSQAAMRCHSIVAVLQQHCTMGPVPAMPAMPADPAMPPVPAAPPAPAQ